MLTLPAWAFTCLGVQVFGDTLENKQSMSLRFFVVHTSVFGLFSKTKTRKQFFEMDKTKIFSYFLTAVTVLALTACNGVRNLVVPHAVSSADAIPAAALNLQKGDYDILASVTETASVTAKYSGSSLDIASGDGDFAYKFGFDKKTGWTLRSFKGTANFGYLQTDAGGIAEMPEAEEFARRVAIARLIETVKDYGADGVLEPIVTTRVSNAGNNKVEYQASATAKIVKIHPTTK